MSSKMTHLPHLGINNHSFTNICHQELFLKKTDLEKSSRSVDLEAKNDPLNSFWVIYKHFFNACHQGHYSKNLIKKFCEKFESVDIEPKHDQFTIFWAKYEFSLKI